jgi:catechol 2,3-dioxygenase-like lactoylglutathione lyase family enzyme
VELDGVRIAAVDVEAATAAYALLLGGEPARLADGVRRFVLERGAIEIAPGEGDLRTLRLVGDPPEDVTAFHGLPVLNGPAEPAPSVSGVAIDHVVVRTADPDRALALWCGQIGFRLALDRVFPERGLRLVFLRSAGMTLELASGLSPEEAGGPDRVHGVSYRVADLGARRERLLAAGVDVSAVRPGMRPGTSVASVRSGTAGVPTLLLQVH